VGRKPQTHPQHGALWGLAGEDHVSDFASLMFLTLKLKLRLLNDCYSRVMSRPYTFVLSLGDKEKQRAKS